jgi:DNA-directed RNA polymerase subunit RPC12/RpoP
VASCRCGFTKEEPLVKFRCLCCGQKIAVNDEGIGVVIACPTCREPLIVPPRSDAEFAGPPAGLPAAARWPELRPHLARLMMSRLFQALWQQRQDLLQSQQAATEQIEALEQRLALLQTQWQRRLAGYQDRIASLEAELAAQIARNQQLQQRDRQGEAPAAPRPAAPRRAALSSGLLLRA